MKFWDFLPEKNFIHCMYKKTWKVFPVKIPAVGGGAGGDTTIEKWFAF